MSIFRPVHNMSLQKLSFISFNLFILFVPFSITISQSFAVLSMLIFLTDSWHQNSMKANFYNKDFFWILSLYLSLLLSLAFNFQYYDHQSLKDVFLKSEFSDIWMSLIIPVSIYFAKNTNYLFILRKTFLASFVLITCSGFISIFTYFRLALYVDSGFQNLPGHRLQHYAGEIYGIQTYLPIGFMNTHLTYGGLLAMFFPGILLFIGFLFRESRYFFAISLFFTAILSLFVFFYNQSRSAWIGVLFCLCLLFYKYKNFFFSFLKKKIVLFGFLIVVLVSLGVGTQLIHKNWLLQRAVSDALKDNTTENQRYFIYKNTINLLRKHYLVGVGPNRFRELHQEESNRMIRQNEQLWYELFITPRGHAHHDILHFFSIGGLLSFSILIGFYYRLIHKILKLEFTQSNILFVGCVVLYMAGFFQCYLLDDEVVLPFFALFGLFVGSSPTTDTKQKESNHLKIVSITFLLLSLLISLVYIFYKTRKTPMEVYKRKIKTKYVEDISVIRKSIRSNQRSDNLNIKVSHAEDGFQVEGCLTHRFANPIRIRKKDFSIALFLPQKTSNPPTKVIVDVIDRDAFDQDKNYKAHEQRFLKRFVFPLYKGKNVVTFPGVLSHLESPHFPKNIKFRDFKFSFEGFHDKEEYFQIPYINLGNLCDVKNVLEKPTTNKL